MEVMRAAENAHFQKLTIAGEPLSKKDAKLLEEAQEEVTEQDTYEEPSTKQPIGALPGDD